MRTKELFYYVTWGSNVTRYVHWCVTVFYQQIENSNIVNQIHGFTIDYGKFILRKIRKINWASSIEPTFFKLGEYNLLLSILTSRFINCFKFNFGKSSLSSDSHTNSVIHTLHTLFLHTLFSFSYNKII